MPPWSYCKHVMNKGIRSNPTSNEGLRVYTDANWAGFYSIDGSVYSRTGVFITYNETPVQWVSSKQSAISGSSANAEIYAISTGCGYGQNVAYIGQELGMQTKFPISLMVDCQPAIQYAQNTGNKTRLKHIDIRSAMVQELRDCPSSFTSLSPIPLLLQSLATCSLPQRGDWSWFALAIAPLSWVCPCLFGIGFYSLVRNCSSCYFSSWKE